MERNNSTHGNKHVQVAGNPGTSPGKRRKACLDSCVNIDGDPAGFGRMREGLARRLEEALGFRHGGRGLFSQPE